MRTIDGAARRRVLAEAVWRIIRRDGFDGASVRAVAAEASLSTGSVRHFFSTQDELHVFAMEELVSMMTSRVRDVLRSWGSESEGPDWTATTARGAVEAVLVELLPLTAEREEMFGAHLQFIVKAAVHPVLQPMAHRLAAELHLLVEHLVQSLVDTGAARADLDVRAAAQHLSALLDGITLRRLTAQELLSRADARRLVQDCLNSWESRP